jgi:outer membrane protein assembly factor BamA
VGGTTDIGVGIGEFTGITRVRRGVDPFVWNIESAGLVTGKLSDDHRLIVPYGDVYVKLVVPRLLGSASELAVRPSFTTETTLGYYGLGNASSDTPPPGQSSSYFWYARTHPSVTVELRWRIVDHIAGHTAVRYTQNWMNVPTGSKLAEDLASGSPEVQSLLGPTSPHGVALFTYGVQWDDRDSEVSPHSGSFHDALVRVSPGGSSMFPYRYAEGTIDARGYVPLWREHLTLALRAVADVLVGHPPVYALARIDEEFALGGPVGVRGIPAQRYAGKVKTFGSLELRADVATFRALGKALQLGVVAFTDAGRVWADLAPHPELDGTGLALKYGVGGGMRLQSGEAFVLRGDLAWSPDARPVGGYFAVGHTF